MSTIRKVAQNTGLYFLSNLILRASSIIFFPIFSFYLAKEDYGILFITQSIVGIITAFSALEIHRAVTRFIYDENVTSEPEEIFSTGIKMSLISNVFWVGLVLVFGDVLLKPVLNDIDFYPYMFYAAIALIFSSIVDNYRFYLKSLHKGKLSFMFELLYYGSVIGLNLFFVAVMKMNVIGLIYSVLLAGMVFSTYIFFKIGFRFAAKMDFILARKMLSFSLPMIPFTILGFLLTTTDRFLLNSFIGKEASGIYYIAFTIGALYSTFKEAFYASYTPWFYDNFKKENYMSIRRMMSYLLGGSAIMCLVISLFSFEVLSVISSKDDFVEAWKYVPFVTTGFLIVFVGQIASLPLFHSKKTRLYFISNLGGVLVLLGIGYFLIQRFEIYGILTAKVLAFSIMALIQYQLANAVSDFRINAPKIFLVVLITFGLSFIHYIPLDYMILLALKIAFIISLVFLFYRRLKGAYYPDLGPMEIVEKLVKIRQK